MARFTLGISLVLLVSSLALTQSDPAAGILPFSTRAFGVDLATSNVMLVIPLRAKSDLSVSLIGNFHIYEQTSGNQGYIGILTGLGPLYGGSGAGVLGVSVSYSISEFGACGSHNADNQYSNFGLTDATGASHQLPSGMIMDQYGCIRTSTSGTTTDGSGYTVNATASPSFSITIYDESGNHGTSVVDYVAPTTSVNPDGLSVSDTSGVITEPIGGSAYPLLTVTHGSGGSSDSYTYNDAGGTQRAFSVGYTNKTLQTDFNCPGIGDIPATPNQYLPTSVSIPGGAQYTITYETTQGHSPNVTGRISTITYASGGSISYTYLQGSDTNGSNGVDCTSFVVPELQVTVSDNNGNVGTWTYVNNNTGSSANFTVTETDPAGDETVHSFSGEYQTQAVFYQGTSSVLKTVTTCYNGTACSGPTLPITETDVYTSLGDRTDFLYQVEC